MKKAILLFVAVLSQFANGVKAQSGMPYLNESAGNDYTPVAGPDSAVYRFFGGELMKIDKHKNVLWTRKFNGFSINNILLSKTGSLFFKGAVNIIGKMNAQTGNVVWVKQFGTYTYHNGINQITEGAYFDQLLLNRNNNLLLSGTSGFMSSSAFCLELDTNGTILQQDVLIQTQTEAIEHFNLINDSAGYYNFLVKTKSVSGTGSHKVYLFQYNSQTHQHNGTLRLVDNFNGLYETYKFYKSQLNPNDVYIASSYSIPGSEYSVVRKLNTSGMIGTFTLPNCFNSARWSLNETKNGNASFLIPPMFTATSPVQPRYTFITLDPVFNRLTGLQTNTLTSQFASLFILPFYDQSVFVETVDFNSPGGLVNLFDVNSPPVCIQSFSQGIAALCTNSNCGFPVVSYTGAFGGTALVSPVQAAFTSSVLTPSVTSVPGALSFNYCSIVLGEEERKAAVWSSSIVYPSPASSVITVKLKEQEVYSIAIMDAQGREVKRFNGAGTVFNIDLTNWASGLYFVTIQSNGKNEVLKFVKE